MATPNHPKDRDPTAAELQYVGQVHCFSRRLRKNISDAALIEGYGAHAAEPMWVSWGPWLHCQHWASEEFRRGDLVSIVSEAWPLTKKGGELPLFQPGLLVSRNSNKLHRRIQPNVQQLDAVVLDFDTGDATLDLLEARAAALGLFAVIYRSPSDGAAATEILRHPGEPRSGVEDVVAPTHEACLAHLIEKGYRREILGPLTIIDAARVVRTTHRFKNKKTGKWETRESVNTKIVVGHNALAKSRLLAFLKGPFQRGDDESARDFNARWVATVLGPLIVALGFYADPSGSDVNRCFYLPSATMPSGAIEDVSRVVRGEPLDAEGPQMAEWRAVYGEKVRSEQAIQAKARARSVQKTTQGLESRSTSVHYALADLLADQCDSRVRADKREDKDGLVECECPFDHLHSNAGDPSDCGFFVTNSGYAGCHHSHGKKHSPRDFIARMLELEWFDPVQLAQYRVSCSRVSPPRPMASASWFGS